MAELKAWEDTCYTDVPSDRIVVTAATICQKGYDYKKYNAGRKESRALWKFLEKIVDAYAATSDHSSTVEQEVRTAFQNAALNRGDAQSFYDIFTWLKFRITSELMPKWEFERIKDDNKIFFSNALDIRATLVEEFEVEPVGIYS